MRFFIDTAKVEDIKKAMNVGSEIAAETLKHYGGF